MTEDPAHVDTAAGNGAVSVSAADVDAIIRGAQRPTKTVPLCLRLDLVGEFEDLDRQLAAYTPRPGGDSRLNTVRGPGEAQALAEKMAALQEQMRAATVVFRLRALHPKRWQEMEDAHPPRKGADGKIVDKDVIGVNSTTFFPEAIRACVYEPVLSDTTWRLLLEGDPEDPASTAGLSDRQYDELAAAAWLLNKTTIDVPFSRAASAMIRAGGPG